MTVKCPICPHQAQSYETLFTHNKNDITSALLRLMENVERKLRKSNINWKR